jgi:hypothetical protein
MITEINMIDKKKKRKKRIKAIIQIMVQTSSPTNMVKNPKSEL